MHPAVPVHPHPGLNPARLKCQLARVPYIIVWSVLELDPLLARKVSISSPVKPGNSLSITHVILLFCFVLFLIGSLSFQVLNLLMIQPAKSDEQEVHAQISWYTASRSSILPCARLKPFLESYEVGAHILLQSMRRSPGIWPAVPPSFPVRGSSPSWSLTR